MKTQLRCLIEYEIEKHKIDKTGILMKKNHFSFRVQRNSKQKKTL